MVWRRGRRWHLPSVCPFHVRWCLFLLDSTLLTTTMATQDSQVMEGFWMGRYGSIPWAGRSRRVFGGRNLVHRQNFHGPVSSELREYALGVNLWTGNGLETSDDGKLVEEFSLLVSHNNPYIGPDDEKWTGAPDSYIVGVHGTLLGNTGCWWRRRASAVPASDTSSRPHFTQATSSKVRGRPHALSDNGKGELATDDPGNLGVVDELNETDTNPNSITQLLVWRDQGDNSSPLVALYTGDDAEYIMENKVAKFVAGQQIYIQGRSPRQQS